MSNMAKTNSTMKGFSVLQPGIGAPLSWMPAVGTKELAQLIDAYIPGPASPQDKRAAIATDFFKFAAETGESFKYYPVTLSRAAPSPASSAFTTSPAMSNMSYGSPSQPSTPAPRPTSSRSPAVKSEKTDYSHLPGMKILTTDGEDVTNALSRGCKTKEQREHAHLMRVLKACDACKKKKIRCDPSHKRRPSSQPSSNAVTKPARKARKPASASASQAAPAASTSVSFAHATELDFDFTIDDLNMDFDACFDGMDIDSLLDFNQPADAVPQDFYGAMPQNFDFYLGNDSLYSPAMTGSTDSINSPAQPLTPTSSGLLPQGDFAAFLQSDDQLPSLPYMTPGPHGSNYADFNLYSPGSSFTDEEPMKLKAGGTRNISTSSAASPATRSPSLGTNAPAELNELRPSSGLVNDQQWSFDQGTVNPQMLRSPVPGDRLQQQVVAGEPVVGVVVPHSGQRAYHGDDGGHASLRAAAATTARSQGLSQQQVMSRGSPEAADLLVEGHECYSQPRGTPRPASSRLSSPVSSRVPSLHEGYQDATSLGGSAHTHSRTVSPSELTIGQSSIVTLLPHTPVTRQSLPSVASTTALLPSDRSEGRDGGLLLARKNHVKCGITHKGVVPVNGGLPLLDRQSPRTVLLPNGGLNELPVTHVQETKPTTVNKVRPATASALASQERALVLGLGFSPASGSVGPLRQEDERLHMSSSTAGSTGSSSVSRLSSANNHGQFLHGKATATTAASSSPRRLPGHRPEAAVNHLLPVRQTMGHAASTSSLLTRLAVFGLVSMLLIVGLTSLLQLQTPLPAHLLPSFSVSSLVLLSMFSHFISHSARSIPSGTASSLSRRRHHLARALAHVPVACF